MCVPQKSKDADRFVLGSVENATKPLPRSHPVGMTRHSIFHHSIHVCQDVASE
jgi:hypothetical protein